MSTLLEAPDLRTDGAEHDDGLQHAAHVLCQEDAPFVILVCGRVAGWDEEATEPEATVCPLCWNTDRCPVCGMLLMKPSGGA